MRPCSTSRRLSIRQVLPNDPKPSRRTLTLNNSTHSIKPTLHLLMEKCLKGPACKSPCLISTTPRVDMGPSWREITNWGILRKVKINRKLKRKIKMLVPSNQISPVLNALFRTMSRLPPEITITRCRSLATARLDVLRITRLLRNRFLSWKEPSRRNANVVHMGRKMAASLYSSLQP